MSDAVTLKVYLDKVGEGRWTAYGRNGEIVADSGEGYAGGMDAARRAGKRLFPAARVVEAEGEEGAEA